MRAPSGICADSGGSGGLFGLELLLGNIWLDEEVDAEVAVDGLVESLGAGKRVVFPTEQRDAVQDGVGEDDLIVAQAQQVQVVGEVLSEL